MTGIMSSSNSSSMRSSLHLPAGANRCRADSGSTYSSSDTSNRSKTSSRRRSHRPRGCRGGSSRKKRRGGKVPKEIVGVEVSNGSTLGASTTVIHDGASTIANQGTSNEASGNNTSVSSSTTTSSNSAAGGKPSQGNAEKVLLKGTTVTESSKTKGTLVCFAAEEDFHPQTEFSDENAGRRSLPHHQASRSSSGNKYMPLTSNAATLSTNNEANKTSSVLPPLKPKTSSTSSASCLPPLQESIKSLLVAREQSSTSTSATRSSLPASSNDPIRNTTNHGGQGYASNDTAASNATATNSPPAQILPPLYQPEPETAQQAPSSEPSYPPAGPNIYALQSTTSRNNSDINNSYLLHNNNNNNNGIAPNSSYPYMGMGDYQQPAQGRGHQLYHSYDNHNRYNQYGANQQQSSNTALLQLHQQQSQQHQQLVQNHASGNSYNNNFVSNENKYESAEEYHSSFHTENNPENSHYSATTTTNNTLKSFRSKRSSNHAAPGSTTAAAYRNERIEKQRQMMAGGGSLFVTSPKSFLMGWKSDDMPRM
ncbi:expressed unknown protein [Seminavis robusta]|uniref:Uncharacterized protein n=1 Tax=Seminavis robusta TaxID=568900 RepID=A0A9N8HFF0_9STRA|nr:expressed unknown protein [Seminavis robusta]|eukprot:Sro452_g145910.1 n/a (538) ;mRNA; r:40205-41818